MRSREIRACLTCYYNVDDRCFAKPTIVRDGEARHPAIFSKMDCCDRFMPKEDSYYSGITKGRTVYYSCVSSWTKHRPLFSGNDCIIAVPIGEGKCKDCCTYFWTLLPNQHYHRDWESVLQEMNAC